MTTPRINREAMIAAGVPERHIPSDSELAVVNAYAAETHKASAFDEQVGGSHYKTMVIQPIEFIVKNNIPFLEGNVIKYVVRWSIKNGLEDLKKARHYIDLLIEMEEGKNSGA